MILTGLPTMKLLLLLDVIRDNRLMEAYDETH